MIELHPAAAREEGLLEGDQQVGREGDVVCDGHQLKDYVDGEVDFAELALGWFAQPVEHEHVENPVDVDEVLELVDVDSNQYDVVVGQGLQQRDDGDESTRVFSALPAHVVQQGKQNTD